MIGIELDEELKLALDNIKENFTGTLKRGYTNVGIRKFATINGCSLNNNTNNFANDNFQFKDVYFKENDNNVILKNLTLINSITSRMSELIPDLLHNVLDVLIDFNDISLIGEYLISNDQQLQLLPIQQIGKIEIIIENVKCYGRIGFTSNGGDSFRSSNFDVDFETGSVISRVYYVGLSSALSASSSRICSEQIKSNIDESIAKIFKRELWWKALQSIQQQLDAVLIDFSLTDLFAGEKELISKYNLREQYLNDFVNKIIDQFLTQYHQCVHENNLLKMEIDNFVTKFSHRWGGSSSALTFWGEFSTFNGNIRNLYTIKRLDDFSIAINQGTSELTIFGNFKFDELGLIFNKYEVNIWNVYTSGNIKATIDNNLIGFKIVIATSNPNLGPFKIRRFDVKIRELENINVEVTGLNLALHWLRLYIITWITGYFNNNIIANLEKKLKSIVDVTTHKSYYID